MVRKLLTDARETSYWISSSLLTAERSTVELPGNSTTSLFSFYYTKQIRAMSIRYDVGMLNPKDHPEFCDSYVAFSGSIWVSWGQP